MILFFNVNDMEVFVYNSIEELVDCQSEIFDKRVIVDYDLEEDKKYEMIGEILITENTGKCKLKHNLFVEL